MCYYYLENVTEIQGMLLKWMLRDITVGNNQPISIFRMYVENRFRQEGNWEIYHKWKDFVLTVAADKLWIGKNNTEKARISSIQISVMSHQHYKLAMAIQRWYFLWLVFFKIITKILLTSFYFLTNHDLRIMIWLLSKILRTGLQKVDM